MSTLTSQVKKTSEGTLVPCEACGSEGWWCRGCGGSYKKDGMIRAGLTENEVDSIYQMQFAGCQNPLVPCYVCNRTGRKPYPPNVSVVPKFWEIETA